MGRTVKEITGKHRHVAKLRSEGLSYSQIAERSGYSIGHVKQICASPQIKELIASEKNWDATTSDKQSVEKVIQDASLDAIQLLTQIVRDSDTLGDHAPTLKQRADAAMEVLKMAGYAGSVKVDHTHRHVLQREDFKEIQRRASEGPVIDVEATPCLQPPQESG